MTVNHLKNRDAQQKTLTVAFGRHAVKGHLCWSQTDGVAAPNHRITAYNALGEGEWDACEAAYYRGIYMPPGDIHFHPGALATGMNTPPQDVDTYFTKDVPHTRTAAIGYKCPQGIGDADTEKSPPLDFEGIFRTKKSQDFNPSGVPLSGGARTYSANPARCLVEALMTYARLPNLPAAYSSAAAYWLTRIDWGSWTRLAQLLRPARDGELCPHTRYRGLRPHGHLLQRRQFRLASDPLRPARDRPQSRPGLAGPGRQRR